MVACGPRLEETLTMLKSALLLSRKPLHFYIFAEEDLHDSFRSTVSLRLLCNTTAFLRVFVFLSSSFTLLLLYIYLFLKLNSWPGTTRFGFTIYPITFPSENGQEWKKLFKPCASQRLFLPVGLQSSSNRRSLKWPLRTPLFCGLCSS